MCSSPRARAGLRMLPASIEPPSPPPPGADDGVQLVDEDDQLVGVGADLLDDVVHPLLEVAPVAGSGDDRGQVQGDHAPAERGCRARPPRRSAGPAPRRWRSCRRRRRRSARGCSCRAGRAPRRSARSPASRPITGSIRPSRASEVRSRPYLSSVGVPRARGAGASARWLLGPSGASGGGAGAKRAAWRMCPAAESGLAARAPSTCSGPM